MVVSRLTGGLGNQLFQYATGRALAIRRDVPFKLDLDWFHVPRDVPGLEMYTRRYRLHELSITAEAATSVEISHYAASIRRRYDRRLRGLGWRLLVRHLPSFCAGTMVPEVNANFQPSVLNLPGDVYLQGFWQNERYFANQKATLRQEFTPRDRSVTERAAALVSSVRRGGRSVVSVQVRRGDVARAHEVLKDLTHMPYELVSKEYLHAAMSRFDDVTFLVFSESAEDLAWCQNNLHASDIHFASGGSDLDDFASITLCDHHIISNSSFGWWAAWLNPKPDKTVILPKRWFRREYAPRHDICSLVAATWTAL